MKAIAKKAVAENTSQFFIGVSTAVILLLGYDMIRKELLNPGQMAALGLAVAMISGAVKEMAKSYNRMLEASAGCERVFELLDQPRETEHESGSALPPEGAGVEY
jgi:ABC-type multidrug transport system fused ATPase/permease subunit